MQARIFEMEDTDLDLRSFFLKARNDPCPVGGGIVKNPAVTDPPDAALQAPMQVPMQIRMRLHVSSAANNFTMTSGHPGRVYERVAEPSHVVI